MSSLIDFFKKYWLVIAVVLIAVLLPTIGHAQSIMDTPNTTIKPKGSDNAWTLYVFGSARVIQELFMSIKLLVAPDIGSTGFITLMYLVATVGFFVLAVAAGFDPSKNFMRMFTYVLVVWGVVFATTKLKADLHIIDKVGNTAPEVVTGAPALIVIPASLISQIGEYFSRSVETYFSIPGNFKMSNVGQFNLFATMLADASQYKIKDEGISKTMTAYAGDCIVPAIARGQFSGPMTTVQSYGNAIINPGAPTASTKTVYGYDALIKTTNLMAAYGTAASNAILTKYYPANGGKNQDGTAANWKASLELSDSVLGSSSNGPDFGVVVPCAAAYKALKKDIENHANVLLDSSSKAWGAAGGNQLYSTLFTDMLSSASSTEGPSSYIRQKALLYEVNNSFKGAAMMAGNNEVLQTLSISQAEQQQKGMMVSAFSVFNNMMGYMYTVLQAFLFGMAPIVILAMLVPGLGKSILVNYMQVLIWLALWSPLLGIVNYIITLFGQYDMAQAFQMAGGGLNKTNDALVTEKANNLIIAGQFLGTLVPMISWGIIKGAMAFTEFINHGIGSQFAAQAGATAATGNYSLNNASADNLSMNKFSTQMSSAVGAGPVQAGLGAGATSLTSDSGGSIVKNAGVQANPSQQLSSQLSNMLNNSKALSEELSAARSKGATLQAMFENHKSSGHSIKEDKALMAVAAQVAAIGKSEGMNNKVFDMGNGRKVSANDLLSDDFKTALGLESGLGSPVPGVTFGYKASATGSKNKGRGVQTDNTTSNSDGSSLQRGSQASEGVNNTTSVQNGSHDALDRSAGQRTSSTKSYSTQDVVNAAIKEQKSMTESLSRAINDTNSMNLGQAADRDMIASMVQKWNNTPQLSEEEFRRDMSTLKGQVEEKGKQSGVTPDSVVNNDPSKDEPFIQSLHKGANSAGSQAAAKAAGVKPPDVKAAANRIKAAEGKFTETHNQEVKAGVKKAQEVDKNIETATRAIRGAPVLNDALNLATPTNVSQIAPVASGGQIDPQFLAQQEKVAQLKARRASRLNRIK